MSAEDKSGLIFMALFLGFMLILPVAIGLGIRCGEYTEPSWCVEWQREAHGRTNKNKASFGTIERSIAFADKLDRLEGSVRIEVKPCD
jgi:hypothetical protein